MLHWGRCQECRRRSSSLPRKILAFRARLLWWGGATNRRNRVTSHYLLNRPVSLVFMGTVMKGKKQSFYPVSVYILEHACKFQEAWNSFIVDSVSLDRCAPVVKNILLSKLEFYKEGLRISVQYFILNFIKFDHDDLDLVSLLIILLMVLFVKIFQYYFVQIIS